MVTIEQVGLQNIETFKTVRLRALADSPSAFGSTYARESSFSEEEWVARVERWNGERGIGYLAMEDGMPCGIAGALRDGDDLTRAQLVSMWTAPTHRRCGVGRLLVESVVDWGREHNVRTLQLFVTSINDAAIRFYEGLEFEMTGRTEPYPNDPDLIEYEMARQI